MLLEPRTAYLVLHDSAATKRQISIVPTLEAAISGWTAGSRLSPVWPVRGYDVDPGKFVGAQTLVFVGPVQPARLRSEIQGFTDASSIGVWLTAGCFNVVLRFDAAAKQIEERVLRWATSQKLAHEIWSLEDSVVAQTTHSSLSGENPASILRDLADAMAKHESPALQPQFQENLVVTATSLTRANAVYPPIFANLAQATQAITATINGAESGKLDVLAVQSRLIGMNAALSRFSSQAFSGTPPILTTECHFWIHSLLGTGSANIALANLVGMIQRILGEARLPERLAALRDAKTDVPDVQMLVSSVALLNYDIMKATDQAKLPEEPIIPLVTYFSGRDGFSSQLQTLSAPLTTLAESNSYRSNLLTVTHEVSHIFVQSALAYLSPTPDDNSEMGEARRLLKSQFKADNYLDAAKQLLLEGVVAMEQARNNTSLDRLPAEIRDMLERWRHEMQEILVHSFDFLYFHQGDPEYYIKSIWHSWCAIPGISDRVPEYLMRTLCAVSANLLGDKPKNRFKAALENTRDYLKGIKSDVGLDNSYVEQALRIIDKILKEKAYQDKLEKEYSARLYLVRLVKIFLHSETLGARLFQDPYTRSLKNESDLKKRLNYDNEPIGNALTFLKRQLRNDPTEAESMWVLHSLAFDLMGTGGHS